jgi:hypothetical protein
MLKRSFHHTLSQTFSAFKQLDVSADFLQCCRKVVAGCKLSFWFHTNWLAVCLLLVSAVIVFLLFFRNKINIM